MNNRRLDVTPFFGLFLVLVLDVFFVLFLKYVYKTTVLQLAVLTLIPLKPVTVLVLTCIYKTGNGNIRISSGASKFTLSLTI